MSMTPREIEADFLRTGNRYLLAPANWGDDLCRLGQSGNRHEAGGRQGRHRSYGPIWDWKGRPTPLSGENVPPPAEEREIQRVCYGASVLPLAKGIRPTIAVSSAVRP